MFYFPLFLSAVVCLAFNLARQWAKPVAYINRPLMLAALAVTVSLMSAVKLSPTACAAIELWFSQWFFAIRLVPDPTDLVALVALPLSYGYAARFFNVRPVSAQ